MQQQAELDEKLQQVAELESIQTERDRLRAEKANLQRMAAANADGANILKGLVDMGLVGQDPNGKWGIYGGDKVAKEAAETKAKAQLLNVSKGKSP